MIVSALILYSFFTLIQAEPIRFNGFYNCDESLEKILDCNDPLEASGFKDILLDNEFFKINKNADSGVFTIVLQDQVGSLSDIIDIKHETNAIRLNVIYKSQDDTETTQLVLITIIEKNTRAPEISPAEPSTYSGISKLYPVNSPLEAIYDTIRVETTDADYVENKPDKMNTVDCFVIDDPKDMIECKTKLVETGKYVVSLQFKQPAYTVNLGNAYTFTIQTKDQGEPSLSSKEKQITLEFTKENFAAPTFSESFYTAEIPNQKFSGVIDLVEVSADDNDGDKVEISLVQVDGIDNGMEYFSIESPTGDKAKMVLKWIKELPKIRPSEQIQVHIQATEIGTTEQRSSSSAVLVKVPIDSNSPILVPDQLEAQIGSANGVLSMDPVTFEVTDGDLWQDVGEFDVQLVGAGSENFLSTRIETAVKISLKDGSVLDKFPDGGFTSILLQVSNTNDPEKKTATSLIYVSYPSDKLPPVFKQNEISGTVDVLTVPASVNLEAPIEASDPDGIASIRYMLITENDIFELQGQELVYIKESDRDPKTVLVQATEEHGGSETPRTAIAKVFVSFLQTSTSTSSSTSTASSSSSASSSTETSTSITTESTQTSDSSPTNTDSSTLDSTTPTSSDSTTPASSTETDSTTPTSSEGTDSTSATSSEGTDSTTHTDSTMNTVSSTSVTTMSSTSDITGTSASSTSSGTDSGSSSTGSTATEETTTSGYGVQIKFLSGDYQLDQQYVPYPSFIVLENSVPMSIARVKAECDTEESNSLIRYSLEKTGNFFVDSYSGDIYAANPNGGSTIGSICSNDDCRIVATATAGAASASITVYVEIIEENNILVINSKVEPTTVLNQLNENKNQTWFRLLNAQLKADAGYYRDEALNKLFITGRLTDSDGNARFLLRDELVNVASETEVDQDSISATEDVFINNRGGEESGSNTAVVVLAVLLGLLVLGVVAAILFLYRRPLLSRIKRTKASEPAGRKLSDTHEDRNTYNDTKTQIGQQRGNIVLKEKIIQTRDEYPETNVNQEIKINQGLESRSQPYSVVLTEKPSLDQAKKKKAPTPIVPPASYASEDVKFNENVEVVEVVEIESEEDEDSSSKGSCSDSSREDDSSDDEKITSI